MLCTKFCFRLWEPNPWFTLAITRKHLLTEIVILLKCGKHYSIRNRFGGLSQTPIFVPAATGKRTRFRSNKSQNRNWTEISNKKTGRWRRAFEFYNTALQMQLAPIIVRNWAFKPWCTTYVSFLDKTVSSFQKWNVLRIINQTDSSVTA